MLIASFALAALAAGLLPAAAQGAGERAGPPAAGLALDQARLQQRMAEVEQRLLEMARGLDAEQPARAEQLRRALALSRESFLVSKMAAIRDLMEQNRYGEAAPVEREVLADLERLVASLSAEQWADELARLRAAEARLAGLLAKESAAAARTGELARAAGPGAAGPSQADAAAAGEQQIIRGEGDALYADLRGGPGAAELSGALKSMSAAEDALGRAARADAMKSQEEASAGLQAALDAVRQAVQKLEARRRAEVRLRLLQMLEQMLKAQQAARAETARLDALMAPGSVPRAVRLALADLAIRQESLDVSADEAMALLKEDPTALALPLALAQVKADVVDCAELLRVGTTGAPAQMLQEEVEAQLQAMIEALRPEEVGPSPAPPEARKGRPSAAAPVDVVLELKVLRSMEVALQRRTAALDSTRGAGAGPPAGFAGQAAQLAERQGRIGAALGQLQSTLKEAGGG
jgi:hypothetical protein